MTKAEVINFMKKIKAYYDYFPIEDYKIGEWYDKLKKYDLEDVYRKFDQHLEGELKDSPPKLHYITKFLKTPEEKARAKINDYTIQCNLCGQWMPLSVYDNKHFDRCSSINYLLRIMRSKGIEVEYKDLELLDDVKFDKVYKKYAEGNIQSSEIGIQI